MTKKATSSACRINQKTYRLLYDKNERFIGDIGFNARQHHYHYSQAFNPAHRWHSCGQRIMAELHEKLDSIKTKEQLVTFIDSLIEDYETNSSEWENADLLSFLQAMSAWWTGSMEYAYKNTGREFPKSPTWDMFARILNAAKIYE